MVYFKTKSSLKKKADVEVFNLKVERFLYLCQEY